MKDKLEQIFDKHHEGFAVYNKDEIIKELLVLYNVVKPKGTSCQTPDKCQMSYYHQIGNYYCSKCEKTGLA